MTNIETIPLSEFNSSTQKRAGVIPYIVSPRGAYFCLGRDTLSGSLTDFGGGVEDRDNSCLDTAFREFTEESLNCFKCIPISGALTDQLVIHDRYNLIVLIKYEGGFETVEKVNRKFQTNLKKTDEFKEVNQLVWISKYNLLKILCQGTIANKMEHKIYHVVFNILKGAAQTLCQINN